MEGVTNTIQWLNHRRVAPKIFILWGVGLLSAILVSMKHSPSFQSTFAERSSNFHSAVNTNIHYIKRVLAISSGTEAAVATDLSFIHTSRRAEEIKGATTSFPRSTSTAVKDALNLKSVNADDDEPVYIPPEDKHYHHKHPVIEIPKHKDLFPLDWSDWIGTLLVGIGLMIAASGGVGGGGIIVPLLIIVYGFHPKFAIPLSNFTILGSSITNMALNFVKRHPDADRPLVDWDLILVMEPLTMAGAVVGAFVGKILPDWLLVILLVILLAQTTYTTLLKAKSQYEKETAAFDKAKKSLMTKVIEEEIELAENTGLLEEEEEAARRDVEKDGGKQSGNLLGNDSSSSSSTTAVVPVLPAPALAVPILTLEEQELQTLLDDEKRTPTDKVAILSVMVLVVIGLNLLKGGGGSFPSPLGIKCGSGEYWVLTAAVFIWVLTISFWMRNILIEKWKLKRRLRYKYNSGDIEWNERNTLIYPSICFFAGFFAGMFGIGGGIVKGPLMLEMGVHPLVASATVAVMIMFTSVAATTMFIAFGTLTWDYAWFLFVVGLVTTTVGQFGVSYLVEKYKRYSFISISIGAVVAISTVLMALQSVFSLLEAKEGMSQTTTLCGK